MNRRNWWRDLRRWEKALALAGVAGAATVVVAAGVQSDHDRLERCPGATVTINIDRTEPLGCDMRPGQELNIRMAPTDWTPEAKFACEDMGGRLEHSHGQVICKDVDF